VCSLNSQISATSENRALICHGSAKSLRPSESLISLLHHGYCDLFLWGNFLKVFGSGQSDIFSGNSMTTYCCVVNTNNLYTLIQFDNSKHRSRTISRLSEGRMIYILSCNIDYLNPLSPCLRSPHKHSHRGSYM